MKNEEILKPYIQEGDLSQIVDKNDCLIAMDKYLNEFAIFYDRKMEEYAIMCGISNDIINEFRNSK